MLIFKYSEQLYCYYCQYYSFRIVFCDSLIQILSFSSKPDSMRKQMQKKLNKLFPTETPHTSKEQDHKLTQIIRTFRENHMKLIHKIQECDKKREIEHQISKRKLSQKYLLEKHDCQPLKLMQPQYISRPFSQIKSDRKQEKGIKQNSRKQNMGLDFCSRPCLNKSEECQEANTSPFDEPNLKLVKVKLNKLVPLSMDRLKERLKLL